MSGMISVETCASSLNSSWDTSGRWDDGGEDPIVDGWICDPDKQDGDWSTPPSDVSDSVGCGLSG